MKNYCFILLMISSALFVQPIMGQNVVVEDSLAIDYTFSREYELAPVTITGTVTLDHKSLINRSGLIAGRTINFPGEDVSSAIQRLWKLNLFSDIQIYVTDIKGDIIFLEIRLKELSRISGFCTFSSGCLSNQY